MAATPPTTAHGILTGFTVGITADRRWSEQAALFERRGAAVLHGPTIRTLPLGAEAPLRLATEDVVARPPAVLIANTGLGMRSWFACADSWGMGKALEGALRATRIYARGPKASGAVHAAGLPVVARARSERLGEIVDMVLEDLVRGERVVIQLDGARASAATEVGRLQRAGAEVVPLSVYRWQLPEDLAPAIRLAEGVIAGRVQAVTFTSGPAARNWLAIAAEAGLEAQLRDALTDGRAVVGCVGPVCAQALVSERLWTDNVVQPDAFRLGPMVRAVTERLLDRRITVELGPTSMVLSGNGVLLGEDFVSLSDVEVRLLATLARRPGAVLTKEALRRAVWAGTAVDDHAVEAAIARLRRRLGDHAELVRAVPRRGYTLRRVSSTP